MTNAKTIVAKRAARRVYVVSGRDIGGPFVSAFMTRREANEDADWCRDHGLTCIDVLEFREVLK